MREDRTRAEPRLVRWGLPWGVQILAPILLLGPAVARGWVLFWGTPLLQFVPWRSLAVELVQRGQMPLWDAYLGMGAPLLANYQTAPLYPPNWILLGVNVAWGHGLLVIAHWIVSGLGMALLARRLPTGRLPATISGLAFGLSGYLVARAGFFSINAAAAWLPWILVGVDGLARSTGGLRDSIRPVLVATAAFSLQWLAGHAQTAWYTLLFALAWWTWRAVEVHGWRGFLAQVPKLAAALLLAFALSGPQLLPTLEYLGQSPRATAFDRELAMTYSFWPWRSLELVAPGLFGHPGGAGGYWGYGNYWEDAIYIGVLPLLLAVGAVATSVRRRRLNRAVTFLVGTAAVTFVLGLGQNTPIFPFLFDHIPTFSLFQAPTRWNLITVACLALLAAIGAERWRPAAGRSLYWLRLGTAGAAAVTLASFLAGGLLSGVRPSMLTAMAWAGVWLFAAGVLGLVLAEDRVSWWRWLVVGMVAANLLVANAGILPMTSASLYRESTAIPMAELGGHRLYMDPTVEYELKFAEAFRFDVYGSEVGWLKARRLGLPNTALLDRIPSANNFDPLVPASFARWMDALSTLPPKQQLRLLALMDVAQAWLPTGDAGLGGYAAVERPSRARWYSQAQWAADDEQALSLVMEPNFVPDSALILSGEPPLDEHAGGTGSLGPVQDPRSGLTRIQVMADGGGWLLLSDVDYPGWRAFIDGQPAPIYRADSIFRAVNVPAGGHVVTFEYQPWSWRLGWIAFGLAAAAILAWVGLRRWG